MINVELFIDSIIYNVEEHLMDPKPNYEYVYKDFTDLWVKALEIKDKIKKHN